VTFVAQAAVGVLLVVVFVAVIAALLAHGAAPTRCQACGLDLTDRHLSSEYCVLCLAERARDAERLRIRNDVREYVQRRQKKAGP